MIRVPEYVAGIVPYQPGKPVEELERELGISGSIKLASNENPIGPSPRAVEALAASLGGLNRYPDGGAYYLRADLAWSLGIDPGQLIFGNGSNELLDIAVRTFLRPGDEAVMATPSFVVYAMAVRSHGCRAIEVPCRELRHDLDAMAASVTDRTRMAFIANPNNPTGTFNSAAEFDRFMAAVPEDVIVVVDEAYFEYVTAPSYADSMKHMRAGRNVIILRTFSKIYGLAALRIGYGIAQPAVLDEMNKIREPFNTNTLAQIAARAALADHAHVQRSRHVNEEGKQYLYAELGRLGLACVPTETNFVFVPLKLDARALYEGLLREGVIIRPMGPAAVRITIGLPEENRRLVATLEKILPGIA